MQDAVRAVQREIAREDVPRSQFDEGVLRLQLRRLARHRVRGWGGQVADKACGTGVSRPPEGTARGVRHVDVAILVPTLEAAVLQRHLGGRGEDAFRAGRAVDDGPVAIGGRGPEACQRRGIGGAGDRHVRGGLPVRRALRLIFHAHRASARAIAAYRGPRDHGEHIARRLAAALRVGIGEDAPLSELSLRLPVQPGQEGSRGREVVDGRRVGAYLAILAAQVQCLDVHVLRVECLGVHIDNHRPRVLVEHVARHALHVDVALDDLVHRHLPRIVRVLAQGERHRAGEIHPRVRRGGDTVQRGEMAEGKPLRVVAQRGIERQLHVRRVERQLGDPQPRDVHRVVDVEGDGARRVVDRGGGVRLALRRPLPLHFDGGDGRLHRGIGNVVLDGAACQEGQGQSHHANSVFQFPCHIYFLLPQSFGQLPLQKGERGDTIYYINIQFSNRSPF